MLSYIQGSTLPEISMAVKQCEHFCNNLRLVQERTIIHITTYLASTSTYVDLPNKSQLLTTNGIVYRSHIEKCIECYLDADFTGGWAQSDADNEENLVLRIRYVITYT